MDDRIYKSLADIMQCITNIESFLETRPKMFETFVNDLCFKNAVQWNIVIIGEAMNRILKIEKEISITSARQIVATRNYVIHGYDSLRDDLIWGIVINHLPLLKEEVIQLLDAKSDISNMTGYEAD